MQIEMTIKGLMVDPATNTPIVILKDKGGERVLSIWVGIFEANAIALQIENVATPRPMTHDLLRNVITDLDGRVDRIVVSDLRDNTFYAVIHLSIRGEQIAIDARPSDAIALANNSRYGLTSAVVTNDLQIAMRCAMELESGSVHINGSTIHDEPHGPFNSIKDSGPGREGGQWSMDELTQLKWVTIQRGEAHYPF